MHKYTTHRQTHMDMLHNLSRALIRLHNSKINEPPRERDSSHILNMGNVKGTFFLGPTMLCKLAYNFTSCRFSHLQNYARITKLFIVCCMWICEHISSSTAVENCANAALLRCSRLCSFANMLSRGYKCNECLFLVIQLILNINLSNLCSHLSSHVQCFQGLSLTQILDTPGMGWSAFLESEGWSSFWNYSLGSHWIKRPLRYSCQFFLLQVHLCTQKRWVYK